MKSCSLFFLSALGFTSLSDAALQVQTYNTNAHDRYANSGSFIGDSYDWSGVGIASNNGWATMISATYFIAAYHYDPVPTNTISFYTTNDASGPSVTRTVTTTQRIGTTDILIGTLDQTPGQSVAAYDIYLPTISGYIGRNGFLNSAYNGMETFMVGKSAVSGDTSFRVGRNKIDSFSANQTLGGSTNDAVLLVYDTPTSSNPTNSLGDDEALLQVNDSGAPLMYGEGAELNLIGINWFNGENGATDQHSGVSFLPNYRDQINTIVTNAGETLGVSGTLVPEPSSVVLSALGALTLLLRRQRG